MGKRRVKVHGMGWGSPGALATPVARVLAGAAVILCLLFVADRLAAMARTSPQFLVDPSRVVDERTPPWLPVPVVKDIRAQLSSGSPVSIFDPDFTQKLIQGLQQASPWIRGAQNVERIYPNRARVDLFVRRPLVSVEESGHRFLLDETGLVIHEESAAFPSDFGFPVYPVFGARPGSPTRVGSVYDDPEVRAAVLVASEIDRLPRAKAETVRGIDVVAFDIRKSIQDSIAAPGEVHLRTANGVLVEWGRAQSDGQLGLSDVPVPEKVRHLERILEDFPGLAGLEEARLNFEKPMFRKIGGSLHFLLEDDQGSEKPSDS